MNERNGTNSFENAVQLIEFHVTRLWRAHSCVPCSHSCEHKRSENIRAFTPV
jgi:hypothetical protein